MRALSVSGYKHHVGCSFGGGKPTDGKLTTTFKRRVLSEQNKTFVLAVAYPSPMIALLPFQLVLLVLEGTALSLLRWNRRYLSDIYLPIYGSLFRHRHELRAARAEVQKKRRISCADFFAAFDKRPYKLRMLLRHGLPRVQ